MKDIVTPVTPEEVKIVIRKCLENAALVNYTRISQVAKVEGKLIAIGLFWIENPFKIKHLSISNHSDLYIVFIQFWVLFFY